MEQAQSIFKVLETTNPILQSMIGSAFLAFLLWFGRLIYRITVKSIKKLRLQYESKKVTKIIIHKYYVNTNGLYFFSQGYFLVIYKALINIIQGLISIFAGFAVYFALSQNNIILGIFIYFGLQFFIEAYSWLNPKLSGADLSKYDKKIVELILDSLVNGPKESLGITHDESKLDDLKKMKNDVDKLYKELIGKNRKK